MRVGALAGLAAVLWMIAPAPAQAQLGALLSPGRLAKAHAHLEGIANCTQCHEQGRRVTPGKCLACHAPVAARIAKKMGVHRNVKDDCVSCHAEHAGVDGELRRFDQLRFDHARVALYPLDGRHAPLAGQCSACHKSRSFLTLSPNCAACHTDVHRGARGPSCANCHSTRTPFKVLSGTFDHSRTRYALSGAHQKVACDRCHVNRVFKRLKFATCTDCHRDPHRGTFVPECTSCHKTATWRTTKVDHTRTAYPLAGRHATTSCESCHKEPAMRVKPKAATCAPCHADIHRGELGPTCESCHGFTTFRLPAFKHPRFPAFFAGQHAPVTCVKCHSSSGEFATAHTSPAAAARTNAAGRDTAAGRGAVRNGRTGSTRAAPEPSQRFKNIPTACAACHKDVHLGQVGTECQTCHSVAVAKFGVVGFSHATTTFSLTGRHEATSCVQCHTAVTAVFPAGRGTAVRFKGVARECGGCHADSHRGQFRRSCQSCHSTTTFKLTAYKHVDRSWARADVGRHARAACGACHKPASGLPRGKGPTVLYNIDARCVACHTDVHRGALGTSCIDCHRP